jgi:hypothetical protein
MKKLLLSIALFSALAGTFIAWRSTPLSATPYKSSMIHEASVVPTTSGYIYIFNPILESAHYLSGMEREGDHYYLLRQRVGSSGNADFPGRYYFDYLSSIKDDRMYRCLSEKFDSTSVFIETPDFLPIIDDDGKEIAVRPLEC